MVSGTSRVGPRLTASFSAIASQVGWPLGRIVTHPPESDAAASGLVRAALVSILVGAVTLRLSAVGLGHPSVSFQPDEDANLLRALRLANGDLNPRYFYYPALLWYVLAAAYRIVFWVGRELGMLATWDDLLSLYRTSPVFFLLGRVISVVFGTATVWCLYCIGRRAFSPMHGLLASCFLAVAFLHVRDSALATTEASLTFFVVLSLLGAVRVLQEGRTRDYWLAGLAAGLATATKYNAVLVLVALTTAHGLRRMRTSLSAIGVERGQFLSACLVASIVFVALNPFILLDWANAWGSPDAFGSLAWEWRYVHTVEYLDLQPAWWYHLSVSLRYGLGMAPLALALGGILRTLYQRDGISIVLLSFAITFFAAIASLQAVFVRYMTPVVPVLCLFAAAGLLGVVHRARSARLRPCLLTGLGLLALLEPLSASVAYGRLSRHVDTRIEMERFIQDTLHGAVVATYGPSVTWRSTIPRWQPAMFTRDPAQSWAEVLNGLKNRNIHYVVRHQSTLSVFSPGIPELDDAIRQSGTLVREFSPYRRDGHPAPTYDQNDAYYFPIGHFHGVVRPGPLVQLYRLDE